MSSSSVSSVAPQRKTPGLGSGVAAAFSKIHPLDVKSAGLLLGEPGLGRDVVRSRVCGSQDEILETERSRKAVMTERRWLSKGRGLQER